MSIINGIIGSVEIEVVIKKPIPLHAEAKQANITKRENVNQYFMLKNQ